MFKLLMISLSLIKAINSGLWLMEYESALTFRPLVNKIINGEPFEYKPFSSSQNSTSTPSGYELNREMKVVYQTGAAIDPRWQKIDKAVPGSIAVIPLQDVVMQEDFCGSPGLKTLRMWMEQADANRNIIGQILYVDSPGGSAQGVNDFSQFIKQLKKPVVSYVEGYACSAAYWIPTATREIISAEKLCVLGSIGAFSTFYDDSKAKERYGYREIEVYAPQSNLKNKIFRDIKSTDSDVADKAKAEYAERFLKPLVEDFHATVKENRKVHSSKMNDAVFGGDIFNATEAVQLGLADSIGNFNYAINRVQQLSKSTLS